MNIVDRYNKTGPYIEEQKLRCEVRLRIAAEHKAKMDALMASYIKSFLWLAYFALVVILTAIVALIYTKHFTIGNITMFYALGLIIFSIAIMKRSLNKYTKEK